jgi:hypothetical protein
MNDGQDDDFWTAYIATTLEPDSDFAPIGRWVLIVGTLIAAAVAAVALLR